MRKGIFFLFLLSFSLFYITSSAYAIGISPATMEIEHSNQKQELILYAINSEGEENIFDIYTSKELSEYITCNKKIVVPPGASKPFKCYIDLPEDMEPGNHGGKIGLRETAKGVQKYTMSARGAVEARLSLFIPYIGKHLGIDIEAPNAVNVALFTITFSSKGTEKINNVEPKGLIKDGKNIVKELNFSSFSLDVNETKTFKNYAQLEPGLYTIEINASFDGKTETTQEEFRMGEVDVAIWKIVNVTGKKRSIVKIPLWVESYWNKPLSVYADIAVRRNGTTISTARTRRTKVSPWSTGRLIAYWETGDIKQGFYNTSITLYFAGKTKTRDFENTIFIGEGYGKQTFSLKQLNIDIKYIIIIILLIILIIMIYLWNKR